MKSRITLTIDEDLLKKIDSSVDGNIIKNRSHAVEMMLRESLTSEVPTKALILAGGTNRDVTINGKNISAPLLTVDGTTIIEKNIQMLKKHGIKDIMICVSKDQEHITKYLGDGTELGVNLSYLKEEEPKGTAGPIREARARFNDTFIVCHADELKDINIKEIYNFHKQNGGKATIALTTVDDPSEYGTALLNGNKILTFVEKPIKGSEPSRLINAGLYILEPEVISLIPEGYSRFEFDVFPKLAAEENLNGFVFSGQWFDISSPEKYMNAKSKWKDQ